MASLFSAKLARRAPALIAATLALVLAAPVPARAERLGADVICGTPAVQSGIAADDLPDINCAAAIVMDRDGRVYFERDADAERKIASVTKVMTAIVALENAKLTDTITVDHAAATVGQASAGLREGDTMSLADALKALLIPSGNDAAMAIASSVGKLIDPASADPFQTFIDAMNAKAIELGMEHSVFANPHGLDFDAWKGNLHSTARDVAKMLAHAMANESFRAVVADTNFDISVTGADGQRRTTGLRVHNVLLDDEGHLGGKTGTTDDAGACFAGAFRREPGGEVYTVVLGCPDNDARWESTRALASWYFGHWESRPLVETERACADGRPLVARVTHADWTDKLVDVVAKDVEASVSLFSLAGEVETTVEVNPVSGDVETGQRVGELTLSQAGEDVASVELVAAFDQAAPTSLEWLLVQFDRLVRSLTGEPVQAATVVYAE